MLSSDGKRKYNLFEFWAAHLKETIEVLSLRPPNLLSENPEQAAGRLIVECFYEAVDEFGGRRRPMMITCFWGGLLVTSLVVTNNWQAARAEVLRVLVMSTAGTALLSMAGQAFDYDAERLLSLSLKTNKGGTASPDLDPDQPGHKKVYRDAENRLSHKLYPHYQGYAITSHAPLAKLVPLS